MFHNGFIVKRLRASENETSGVKVTATDFVSIDADVVKDIMNVLDSEDEEKIETEEEHSVISGVTASDYLHEISRFLDSQNDSQILVLCTHLPHAKSFGRKL
ncbi:hypothetical protein CI610_03370 [invertebrate metagenome]|uniref:Uncharacterized protein n=1 Tax=invertebrate metagenome TaxID=1711999 RepID=A0A2H9T395_9ZZZZ